MRETENQKAERNGNRLARQFPATSFLGCNSKKEKGPHKTKKAQSNMGLKNGPGKCNENIKTHRKGEKNQPMIDKENQPMKTK